MTSCSSLATREAMQSATRLNPIEHPYHCGTTLICPSLSHSTHESQPPLKLKFACNNASTCMDSCEAVRYLMGDFRAPANSHFSMSGHALKLRFSESIRLFPTMLRACPSTINVAMNTICAVSMGLTDTLYLLCIWAVVLFHLMGHSHL